MVEPSSDPASLYSTLGVEPDADVDAIKRAYRRLSRTYHPDRRLDADEKAAAGPHWLKINAAYDVLIDEKKRMVYDELGGQNLVDGLALLQGKSGSKIASADDLHREWRRAQSKNAEMQKMSRMGVSGSVVVSTSMSEVLQPSDPATPWWRRLAPRLSSVAMSEDMHMALDRRNTLSISNQALTKAGLGGSTLRIGFKRQLSAVSSVQLGTSLSHEPHALDLSASRRLSAHSTGAVSLNLAARGISGLTFMVQRNLTRRALGDVSLTLPLLSFLGLPSADTSSLKLHVHRAPLRLGTGAEEGDDDDDDEANAPSSSPEASAGDHGGGSGGGGSGDAAAESSSAAHDEGPAPAAGAPPADGAAMPPSMPRHHASSSALVGIVRAPSLIWSHSSHHDALAAAGGEGEGGAARAALAALSAVLGAIARAGGALADWLASLDGRVRRGAVALHRLTKRRLGHSGGEVVLTPGGGARYGTSLVWRHSRRSRSKVSVRFGFGTFSITLSTERALSLTSASSVGVALSLSERGLSAKLRIQRHGHRMMVPIYLAARPSARELAAATAAPLALCAVARQAIVRPLRARRRAKHGAAAAIDAAAASDGAVAARRLAAGEAKLLAREAASREREERDKGGLVILAAIYGDVDAYLAHCEAAAAGGGGEGMGRHDGDEGDVEDTNGDGWVRSRRVGAAARGLGCWLDVRVPMQYAVADSMLRLPAQSKAAVRGFSSAPPPPAAPLSNDDDSSARGSGSSGGARKSVRLWVRYRLADEIRTACVGDEEALQLGPA